MKMYEDRRCNKNSSMIRAAGDGQFVLCFRDKWQLPVDFCRLDCCKNLPEHCSFCHLRQWKWTSDIMLDRLWPRLATGNFDEYLNPTLWVCSSVPQPLQISLFSSSLSLSLLIFPFPLFSLCFLSLHLRIWFVMVTERGDRKKCLLQGKKCL